MIVDSGLRYYNDAKTAKLVADGARFGLFTANTAIVAGTALAALTASEPAWSGYARQASGPWTASVIAAGVAKSDSISPVFTNNDSVDHTFRGWFLVAGDGVTLIAAVNLGADVTIPAHSTRSISPTLTDAAL